MNGEPIRAQPKPAKRAPKARKPLRARRWGVSRSKRGTAHGRRPRDWGRMAFYSQLWCMLRDLARGGYVESRLNDVAMACSGRIEVAHLGARAGWRRCPDSETAPLCRHHHQGIDGKIGGRAKWYVALGRDGQRELREILVLFAADYWTLLTDAERAKWDEVAAQPREARRAA